MDGSNAKRADGSLLSMRHLATSGNPSNPFWKAYTERFRTPVWIDDVVQRAFAGLAPYARPEQRVQLIVKSLESSLQVASVMNLLDDAITLAKDKKTDPKTGAPRLVDAAWALYVGGEPRSGLWTVSMKRANEFGTKKNCDISHVAENIRTAFLAAQKAAKAGDVEALTKARNTIQSQLFANYVQATITYANEMYLDKAANLTIKGSPLAAEHQTETYAFYRTIAGLVASANTNAADALDYFTFPGNEVTAKDVDIAVARALGSTWEKLGITPKDVGQYGRKQPELGCKAYVASPSEQGGLLSSTVVKGAVRPEAPAAAPKAPAAAPKPAGKRRFFFFL